MGWDNPGGGGGGPALPLDHDDPAQIINVGHAIDSAEHTGVLADAQIPASIARDTELHAEIHAIDGADHTGVLVDGQIPASIARDTELHAQLHSIIGADHSGFPGGTATFLRADATFAAPTAAAADPVYSPGSFTVVTETGRLFVGEGKLTGAQEAIVQGTGRVTVVN
jgi:hypothetical protein